MKKIVALILIGIMMLSSTVWGIAAPSDFSGEGGGAKPRVSIVAVNIDDTYLEVGISIDSASQDFRSVGAVLKYNADALEACDWAATGNAISLPSHSGAGQGWEQSAVLPAKGPDGLSGKAALAYTEQTSTGAVGYLYLSAESPKPEPLAHQVPTGTPGGITDGGMPFIQAGTVTQPVSQAMTVRFQYKPKAGAGSDPAMCTIADAGIDLVGSTTEEDKRALANSPAGGSLHYWGADIEPLADTAVDHQLVLVAHGKSVDTGGTSTTEPEIKNPAAVTFFDWDGTLMGVKLVPKGDATSQIAEFEASQVPLLNGKKGYDFDTWIYNDQSMTGLFPANPQKIPAGTPGVADWSNVTVALVIVKAAYSANGDIDKEIENAVGVGKSQYTFSNPVYNRYGQALEKDGKYSITYTVKRENLDGAGVTRLKSPAVVALLTPDASGAKDVVMLIPISNTDVTTVEVVPNKAIKELWLKVIDTYGITNWPGASDQSEKMTIAARTFVENGSLGFMRTYSVEAALAQAAGKDMPLEWTDQMDLQTFTDAGYTKVTTTNLAAAKTDLLTVANVHGTSLTLELMQAALKKYK